MTAGRRHFLKLAVGGGFSTVAMRLWAAPRSVDSRLLVVMLRGGYDGASLLVPYASSFYYEARPTIAVARPNPADPKSAVDLGAGYGLNPQTRTDLFPFWAKRQAVFIPFSGIEDLSRSHFESQDNMELGQGKIAREFNSGYLNRLVLELGGAARAISFTDNLALSMKGTADIPNLSLRGDVRMVSPEDESVLASMYQGRKLDGLVQEGFDTRRSAVASLAPSKAAAEMEAASRGARPASSFEKQARSMATLMREDRYAVGFIDIGGWDTHVGQGSVGGQLGNNLANLSQGLSAFAETLGSDWNKTFVVVMSEFGRTFRENGNHGTDHGHGNTMWVLGGGLSGGFVAGDVVDVKAASLLENRDFPVLNEYRSVLGYLFSRMYDLPQTRIAKILPGVANRDFRFA